MGHRSDSGSRREALSIRLTLATAELAIVVLAGIKRLGTVTLTEMLPAVCGLTVCVVAT
jgi:hypothetical protein